MNSSDTTQGNTGPSVSELQQRAERHRASLDHSLNDLEKNFSPNHLVEQSLDYFRDHGGDMAHSLSRSVKENPIPLLLTGVGIAWLMASQSSGRSRSGYVNGYEGYRPDYEPHHFDSSAARGYRGSSSSPRVNPPVNDRGISPQSYQPGSESLNQSRDNGEATLDGVKDTVSEWSDAAVQARKRWEQRLDELKQQSGESVEDWQVRAQANLSEMQSAAYRAGRQVQHRSQDAGQWLKEQPLIAGALGVAAGALIGALMPSTRVEDDMLGARSDKLISDAQGQASELVEKAAVMAESRIDDAKSKVGEAIDSASEKMSENDDSESGESSRIGSRHTSTV